jgi:class 3 adenylate cyclase
LITHNRDMSEREIRYCTTEEGVRIAYCLEGEGPPLLALPFFVEAFSRDHYFPPYRDFMKALSAGRTLIRLDWQNSGLSQRGVSTPGLAMAVSVVKAVVDNAGLTDVDVWASTVSGPIAIEFCVRHANVVRHLVLYGTFATPSDFMPLPAVEAIAHLAGTNWPLAAQAIADMTGRREFPDESAKMADWYLESISADDAEAALRQGVTLDVGERLRDVRTPTLILHRVQDPTFPFACAEKLAEAIPNARLVPLDGKGHLFAYGDYQPIIRAVHEFLGDPGPKPDRANKVLTVLFTDIVDHASMMQRLGDAKGRDVLREHERITRDLLKQHGGAEVKTMGDGFMASFGSVTKAMDCAIALQRAFDAHEGEPLQVRVGLNAGEPIEEDGDLFGSTVIMASRIAAKAGAGEILIPEPLHHLLTGKSYLYDDRGETMLKGFEDAVRLYEVRWRE